MKHALLFSLMFFVLQGCSSNLMEGSLASTADVQLQVFGVERGAPSNSKRNLIFQVEGDGRKLLETTGSETRGLTVPMLNSPDTPIYSKQLLLENQRSFSMSFLTLEVFIPAGIFRSASTSSVQCRQFRQIQSYIDQYLTNNPTQTQLNIDATVDVTYDPNDARRSACSVRYKINGISF